MTYGLSDLLRDTGHIKLLLLAVASGNSPQTVPGASEQFVLIVNLSPHPQHSSQGSGEPDLW